MFCSFAIFIDTASKFPKNEQQHNSLPHIPFPPRFLTSSLTPICLNSILVLNIAAKSFTKSLKSILPSALKKKSNLLLSNLYSTSVSFISNPCSFIFFSQIFKASFSFSLFSSCCFLSLFVATLIIFFKGFTNLSSGMVLFAIATSPYSFPIAVSTITCFPCSISIPSGSKKYILPGFLNLTPIILAIYFLPYT